jgi:hypothetical protein
LTVAPAGSRKPSGLLAEGEAKIRWRRSPLAERIEHAFADRCSHLPQRATLAIGRGNARVHLILQTKGERATLLALCRPDMRLVVGRALADARVALAARGVGVDILDWGGRSCSSIRV